jgi:hypothetical protein
MHRDAGHPLGTFARPPVAWGGWLIALLTLIAVAGGIGGPQGPGLALVAVLESLIRAGWPAGVLLLSAWGLGRLAGRWAGAARAGFAVGLAALLTAFSCLGMAGLLTAPVVWLVCLPGLVGAGVALRRRRALASPPGWLWAGLPGIALLLVAASNPPGALWASEYGGYDALSYHLQLPREWLALGHTRPLEHNIYSFLPGALEVGFVALAQLAPPGADGLLAGGGWRLLSAQYLHAGIAVGAAGLIARLCGRLATAAGAGGRGRRVASAVGGGLVLATPWSAVVGSLAYNEMGVLAIGAGAMLVAAGRSGTPGRQAALTGALVGVACCVKPTALFFVGLPAGVLLLRFLSWRVWGRAVLIGSIAGVLGLAPWLVRNAAACGNPVFPFAAGTLGRAHWNDEQAARWSRAHAVEGSPAHRLRLAVWTDPDTAPGAKPVARWRGVTNPQWGALFPAAAAAGGALLIGATRRRIGVGLLLGLGGQLGAWIVLTHIQSRFLLPCLLTAGPLIAVAAGSVRAPRGLGAGVGVLLCVGQAALAWSIFAGERGGRPNGLLLAGPSAFLGDPYDPGLGRVSPVAFVNHELPAGAVVWLVGGATPLYLRPQTRYATTWDEPTALALAEGGASGRSAYVMVDFSELSRQEASGYLDPRVSPGLLERVLSSLEPVRAWTELGVRLYRVPPAGAEP